MNGGITLKTENRTEADDAYFGLLSEIEASGVMVETRNHLCRRIPFFFFEFTRFPLVTVKPVAVRKALIEMEWFMSKESIPCPDEIKDWWEGQLDPEGYYCGGYGDQLRRFSGDFDQIIESIRTLENHPYSRRNIITSWNPKEMSFITRMNDNDRTPATCHLTLVQFFVRPGGFVHVNSYQRSGDTILGIIHNWVQHWALFTWMCHRAGLHMEKMVWIGGDLHVYQEESHKRIASCITEGFADLIEYVEPKLIYNPSSTEFKASDFSVEWTCDMPEPMTKERAKLL